MIQNPKACGHCREINPPESGICSRCGNSLADNPADPTTQSHSDTTTTVVGTVTSRRITGALLPDNRLGSRYRIIEIIGKGRFGAVYKAQDERFQAKRIVAIKEMSNAQLNTGEK